MTKRADVKITPEGVKGIKHELPQAARPFAVAEKAGAFVVQDADRFDMTPPIGRIDAHLFASAPDLLACIIEAYQILNSRPDVDPCATVRLQAAIAKAEGK